MCLRNQSLDVAHTFRNLRFVGLPFVDGWFSPQVLATILEEHILLCSGPSILPTDLKGQEHTLAVFVGHFSAGVLRRYTAMQTLLLYIVRRLLCLS